MRELVGEDGESRARQGLEEEDEDEDEDEAASRGDLVSKMPSDSQAGNFPKSHLKGGISPVDFLLEYQSFYVWLEQRAESGCEISHR